MNPVEHRNTLGAYSRDSQNDLDTVSIYEQRRIRDLIRLVTFELIGLGFILLLINVYLEFGWLMLILSIGITILFINLYLLQSPKSTTYTGHILNILVLLTIFSGNMILGSISHSYMGWIFASPILASATLGLRGLIGYGSLSFILLCFLNFHTFTPIYIVPSTYLPLIDNVNIFFTFLLIMTVLYNLITTSMHFETLLKEQYYLISSDKKKFHYLSQHDSLTNLPNRSFFYTKLQQITESIDVSKEAVTLFFMDLDGFKKINDELGHEFGDILLLHAGKRLKSCFRNNDFLARLGGDEFTAILIHNKEDGLAKTLAHRITQEFQHPFHINNQEIQCELSIGMATYPTDSTDFDKLIHLSDQEMYSNKKRKKITHS